MRSIFLVLVLGSATAFAFADGTTSHDALVNTTIRREQTIVKTTIAGKPLIETYLQFFNSPDSPPISDRYVLSELKRTKSLGEDKYVTPATFSLTKLILGQARRVVRPNADKFMYENFVDMISPDLRGFNRGNYNFQYVRTSFINSRRVVGFDVKPRSKKHIDGRFLGRIWIDQQDQVIVRFTGVFESHSTEGRPEYLHFDSWRKKSTDTGDWRPYAIYMQDDVRGHVVRGQIRLWAYDMDHLALLKESENVAIHVDNADDASGSSQDVSPLEAAARWRDQAEDNILERLEKAGLLAEPGSFEKVLNQIVTNLEIPNNLNFAEPVTVRILLTLPVEATVIDHTVLLSKGLIDTVPDEEVLASVLALELAHAELGHHVDTMFAFNDKLVFTNTSTYMHLRFAHTERDNLAAGTLAAKYLVNSMYKDKLDSVANYYAILMQREDSLHAISHGYLGDSLISPEGRPWISKALPTATLKKASSHPGAEPTALSSMLAVDPDLNSLSQVLPRMAPGPGDTPHPLEIMPMWLNLTNENKKLDISHPNH